MRVKMRARYLMRIRVHQQQRRVEATGATRGGELVCYLCVTWLERFSASKVTVHRPSHMQYGPHAVTLEIGHRI